LATAMLAARSERVDPNAALLPREQRRAWSSAIEGLLAGS